MVREIRVAALGPHLTSREAAAGLRRNIEAALREGKDVHVDFTGVRSLTPSFATECFLKLARRWPGGDLSSRMQVKGAGPLILAAIRYSVTSGQAGLDATAAFLPRPRQEL